MTQRSKIKVTTADELRDALPCSGVFDMYDCAVEIEAPLDSDTKEIEKMVNILEAAINVINVVVLPEHQLAEDNQYTITITEVPVGFAERTKK